ncbi:MAG: DegT/DnrJ/EryC1/StrS family aminotransferase [Candidatus Moduliflexus flocculans]|nr:DegT/DnrJ/EryC1/StrS family aminotransferase [Candidatus Moduliflexus flocculans]
MVLQRPQGKRVRRKVETAHRSPHAFLVANGTVSMQLALEALGIGYGDEVIVPGLTWQATAAAVLDVNAVPVLVDVKPDTWCIDPERISEAITDRTKAVIPVHLYSSMADMDAVLDIAAPRGLAVIEDAAHQHGGRWRDKALGTIGDIGSFGLQLSKVLTSGEEGILVARDAGVAARLDALRNCGRRPSNMVVDKATGQYGTDGDFIQSGNYRITEFQAAVLLAQLDRFDEQARTRRERAKRLDQLLAGLGGVVPMGADPRETEKAYFKYAFRFDPNRRDPGGVLPLRLVGGIGLEGGVLLPAPERLQPLPPVHQAPP